jgi:selenide,water dikinase
LRNSPVTRHPDLLVGLETSDDAAVYVTPGGTALVQTVDFFTPVVDDPYDWGRITAANALSDVYAMGGTPITALQLVGWPRDTLPFVLLEEVIAGGAAVMEAAGCTIVGGHSIDDPEPKYGFAVTGLVEPDRLVTNAGAQPGDSLVLTKPLGTGIIATAIKNQKADTAVAGQAVEIMAALNEGASRAMTSVGVNAATDITGFGLLGHLTEMLEAAGLAAELSVSAVPLIDGVLDLAGQGILPGGSKRNLESVADSVDFGDIPVHIRNVLADAQTSGGLLISVHPDRVDYLLEALEAERTQAAAVIGSIVPGSGIRLLS